MRVFWWPTALWLVSGATTVTSPIPSSACLSASRPRDSTPSSLVTRIRGRLVHSPSGRAWTRSARGPPRAAPPASGSPRSLSRSRRSVRARSRVMSGTSSAALAAGPTPVVAHVGTAARPSGGSSSEPGAGDGPAWPLAGSAPPEAPAEPPDAASADGSTAPAGCRLRAGLVDVGGAAGRRLARDPDRLAVTFLEPAGGAPGDRPVARRPVQELEREGRHDRRDRDPEDRPGDARDPAADEDRAEDHDRVDARPRPA